MNKTTITSIKKSMTMRLSMLRKIFWKFFANVSQMKNVEKNEKFFTDREKITLKSIDKFSIDREKNVEKSNKFSNNREKIAMKSVDKIFLRITYNVNDHFLFERKIVIMKKHIRSQKFVFGKSFSNHQIRFIFSIVQTFHIIFITKNATIQQLNFLVRRCYLINLNNKHVDDSIDFVFFNVRVFHETYKLLRKKCSKFFKTWKLSVLNVVANWMTRWMKIVFEKKRDEFKILNIYRDLKREMFREFEFFWLETVFRFVVFAIDLSNLSEKIFRFSRCKSLFFYCLCFDLHSQIRSFKW